ncbi:hypothetical protein CDD80_3032 [Ophiocordyceps camponoti-rufipedis]|uniref:Uncharacterized protein n=1 Tax=Ophiocordyceps camponoti-rufipedis TaxID=2004952 RepID=A0A2C5ZJK5_9HYPO|nr:hypothetical protein CDD80_3032 [Ophiocordyceps camponoti-rufipedis]
MDHDQAVLPGKASSASVSSTRPTMGAFVSTAKTMDPVLGGSGLAAVTRFNDSDNDMFVFFQGEDNWIYCARRGPTAIAGQIIGDDKVRIIFDEARTREVEVTMTISVFFMPLRRMPCFVNVYALPLAGSQSLVLAASAEYHRCFSAKLHMANKEHVEGYEHSYHLRRNNPFPALSSTLKVQLFLEIFAEPLSRSGFATMAIFHPEDETMLMALGLLTPPYAQEMRHVHPSVMDGHYTHWKCLHPICESWCEIPRWFISQDTFVYPGLHRRERSSAMVLLA